MNKPYPGSFDAVQAGCRCPVVDNGHGRGYMGGRRNSEGRVMFVVVDTCPLHGVNSDSDAAQEPEPVR
jgi:hypothetical protein